MSYREQAPTGPWADAVACSWTSTTDPPTGGPHGVVPDGCVDLLWSSNRGLVVVGPMTRPAVPTFPVGTEHVALRLRPGRASHVLGVSPAELVDAIVPLDAVVGRPGRQLSDRLDAAGGTGVRLARLLELEGLTPAAPVDRTLLAALGWYVAAPGRQVDEAAARVGWSSRRLRRRTVAAVGYGPKRLQRIVRVQRVLAAGRGVVGDLARLAAELGFADQAHLAREVGLHTGRPPLEVLGAASPTLLSGSSKRDPLAVGQAG